MGSSICDDNMCRRKYSHPTQKGDEQNEKKSMVLSLCASFLLLLLVDACTAAEGATGSSPLSSTTDEPSIIYKDVFGLSSEGGHLQAIMLNGDVQHLYVRLFGVLGQVGFNYFFTNDDSVVICITRENYTEPFYMMPPGILHMSSIDRERFILLGDRLYSITVEGDELHEAVEEIRYQVIEQMNDFIAKVFE